MKALPTVVKENPMCSQLLGSLHHGENPGDYGSFHQENNGNQEKGNRLESLCLGIHLH